MILNTKISILNDVPKKNLFISLHVKSADNSIDDCLLVGLNDPFKLMRRKILDRNSNVLRGEQIRGFIISGKPITDDNVTFGSLGLTETNDGEPLTVILNED